MEQKKYFYLGRSWVKYGDTVPSIALCAVCDCFQTLEGALDLKKQNFSKMDVWFILPSVKQSFGYVF